MSLTRSCPSLIVAAAPSLAAAPDERPDPATLKDKVTIGLGKKLAVQFDQKGALLSKPKTVEKATKQPPTVTFDFRKQGDMLILITQNPFKKDLKFRALARHKGRKEHVETSIVPVKAGLLSFELWKDPIEELVLFEFKLVED